MSWPLSRPETSFPRLNSMRWPVNVRPARLIAKPLVIVANADAPATSSMLPMPSPRSWLRRAAPTPTGCVSPAPRSPESAQAYRHHGDSALTIFMTLIALIGSTRKQCPSIDDLFHTRFFEGRDAFESADRQTQIEFSQEGPQIMGQAFCTAIRKGISVRPPNPDCRRTQRQRDDRIGRRAHAGVEHDWCGTGRFYDPRQQLQC